LIGPNIKLIFSILKKFFSFPSTANSSLCVVSLETLAAAMSLGYELTAVITLSFDKD